MGLALPPLAIHSAESEFASANSSGDIPYFFATLQRVSSEEWYTTVTEQSLAFSSLSKSSTEESILAVLSLLTGMTKARVHLLNSIFV